MKNLTPVYAPEKISAIHLYMRGLGIEFWQREKIVKVLVNNPDKTISNLLPLYSEIRVAWSLIKAGYTVTKYGTFKRDVNNNFIFASLSRHLEILVEKDI